MPDAKDDRTVAEKLLDREEAAHRSLGSVEAMTGLYDARLEEDRLVRDLLEGTTVDESYAAGFEVDVLADLMAAVGEAQVGAEPKRVQVPMMSFLAPPDLVHRLGDLPRSYLRAHAEGEELRLKVTFDRKLAQRKLDEARQSTKPTWPEIAFLSDVHPMVEWLVDKVLARLGRQQALVLTAAVPEPVFLVQGVYCNRLGQPTVVEWMAVSGLPDAPQVGPMVEALTDARVGPNLANPGRCIPLDHIQALVPAAVEAARVDLAARRAEWDAEIAAPLREHRRKLERYEQDSLFGELAPVQGERRRQRVHRTVREQTDLVTRLETAGDPLLRLLAVLVDDASGSAEGVA